MEPILSLSFSMHSNKGIYALLLGSGISRSAGIPTGWEVVLDLVRKLSSLVGEDCEPDPAAWYLAKYGEAPDYSNLLDAIAKTPAERAQLLKSYFEPTDDEREQGLKIPTQAHKAIAKLVQSGYVRVIVSTNFDRLMETALEQTGISPTLISTPDASEGALPLSHASSLVVKVHGDYLDSRLKNTPAELSEFDPRIDQLLDRIFDEFGLLVSGWSAKWDVALRAALERCKTFRFTTYWTTRGELNPEAQKLFTLRRGQLIPIRDSDSFFQDVAERVFTLEELNRPHPESARVAVATLKRYIVTSEGRIRLRDLVAQETEKLHSELSEKNLPVQGRSVSQEEFVKRIRHYEALCETCLALLVSGCYWGGDEHDNLWAETIERIANPAGGQAGLVVWLKLRLYPALLLLYAGGMASVAARKYGTLSALFTGAKLRDHRGEHPLASKLNTWKVMEASIGHWLPGMDGRYAPLSDYLFGALRDALREFLPSDDRYVKAFDRFEYLLAMAYADLTGEGGWVPVGSFGWRNRHEPEMTVMEGIREEMAVGADWPPLRAGMFNGSHNRAIQAKTTVDTFVSRLPWM